MMNLKFQFRLCLLLILGSIGLASCNTPATKPVTGIDDFWQGKLDTLIALVKANDAVGLAKRVSYPLRRSNPVPDLPNDAEFVQHYPLMFDSAFKALLLNTSFDSTNTMVRNGQFMLLSGEIWFGEDGKIIAINYQSPAEEKLKQELQRNLTIAIHPDVAAWQRNVIVWQCPEYLLRVDEMPGGELRFVSWTHPKTFKDKPDIQIMGGKSEMQGTMGGETYTFEQGEVAYVLDNVRMAESEEDMGLFYIVQQKGKEDQRYRCEVSK